MNTKMAMKELPEAVQAYADSGFDPEAMRPLMDLLQQQTQFVQDRFWKMADAEAERRRTLSDLGWFVR